MNGDWLSILICASLSAFLIFMLYNAVTVGAFLP